MIEPPFANKRSWLLTVAIIAFAATVIFSIYFKVKLGGLNSDLRELEKRKESLTTAVITTETGSTTATSLLDLKEKLSAIELNQLPWSRIVEKIETTIPRQRDTNSPVVVFQSYSGNEDGKVSVSAVTRQDAFDPFADIALTIRAFNADPSFKRIFVPSISKSMTPDGAIVLSFSFNFEYQKTTL